MQKRKSYNKVLGSYSSKNTAETGMVAVLSHDGFSSLKLPEDVWVANENSPTEIVLAGKISHITSPQQLGLVSAKIVPLNVGGLPLHSPLMEAEARKFVDSLKNMALSSEAKPAKGTGLGAGVSGETSSIRDQMYKHLVEPV